MIHPSAIILSSLLLTALSGASEAGPNGFDLRRHAVPPSSIRSGGPPRDGIPAIDRPRFVPASQAGLSPSDRVLGLFLGGQARAYPLPILNWHEVVNDELGGRPVVITYCPLTDSGIAFDRRVGDKKETFGVSGLLYNSNVLLYDRESESLWTQIGMRSITGPKSSSRLSPIALYQGSWAGWKALHPETLVLVPNAGTARDYERDPYEEYRRQAEPIFPVERRSERLPPKTRVVGVILGGKARAYALEDLDRAGGPVFDRVGAFPVRIDYDPVTHAPRVTTGNGRDIPHVVLYWFGWYAFHPDTTLWRAAPS